MASLKKIAAPRVKRRKVFNDEDPAQAIELNNAFALFVRALCLKVLEWPEKDVTDKRDGPLSLNLVLDQLMTLKTDRDAWRTRCESIEAAFNKRAAK